MARTTKPEGVKYRPLSTLSREMILKTQQIKEKKPKYDGNFGTVISTGSTLLDLAISGGVVRGGGIPGGILVEAFGPNGSGKTVLLCEIAGAIQRQGGEIMFHDPEARLNRQFAQIFDFKVKDKNYSRPNTVTEVFKEVRAWEPESKEINGIMTDSLAALSTELEMEKDEGDKMGMKRAKEFSEELRKTCRILAERNLLMVCSNQIRENAGAGMFEEKTTAPGGKAMGFYASLRLKFSNPEKIKIKKTIAGKEVTRVIGVNTQIEIYKSSVWKPYRKAEVTILFDYGIDDIRQNLQFVKDFTKNTCYSVNGETLDKSLEKSIRMVEDQDLVKDLKEEVIDLWESIEASFSKDQERKSKQR
jgi:recombination protein RecA